jgi:phosphate transport system substrate-binding protein
VGAVVSTLYAFSPNDPEWDFWFGGISVIIGIVGIILAIVFYARGKQTKRFAYEVVTDAGLVNPYKDMGDNIKIMLDGQELDDARLLVIKISNTGNTPIKRDDYDQPIRFRFPLHDILKCSIQDTSLVPPGKEKEVLHLNNQENFVELRPPVLNAGDEFNIKIFTRGIGREVTGWAGERATSNQRDRRGIVTQSKVDMHVEGHVTGGKIVKAITRAPLMTTRNLFFAIGIFLTGLLVFPSVGLIGAFVQGNCAIGAIRVGGSSAFYSRVIQEAQSYHTACPVAFIDVQENSSTSGLRDLQAGRIQVANSEIAAHEIIGSEGGRLKEHHVAGIVFAVILNRAVDSVSNLSTQQVKDIYNGKYQNWSQLGGKDIPITVVSRLPTSGTYAAFVKHALGGQKPALPAGAVTVDTTSQVVNEVEHIRGAIGYVSLGAATNSTAKILAIDEVPPNPGTVMNGKYRFWTIEYMYTSPNPDALSTSFIAYLQSRIVTNDTFVRIDDISAEVLAKHG